MHPPQPPFHAEVVERDDTLVLRVTGELDIVSAKTLFPVVDSSGGTTTHVIFDLRDCTFVDSTGIRLFVRARNHVDSQGGTVTLEGVSEGLHRVLEVLGLLDVFVIVARCDP